jgi:hypothetical protein
LQPWLLALENAIDVAGGATVEIGGIGAEGDQATGACEAAQGVDRGQAVPGRRCNDQFAMNNRHRAPATARAPSMMMPQLITLFADASGWTSVKAILAAMALLRKNVVELR